MHTKSPNITVLLISGKGYLLKCRVQFYSFHLWTKKNIFTIVKRQKNTSTGATKGAKDMMDANN